MSSDAAVPLEDNEKFPKEAIGVFEKSVNLKSMTLTLATVALLPVPLFKPRTRAFNCANV